MFEGNRFFPDTGTPIWKIARRSTVFELCEPDPFAVATWMEKSFTTGPSVRTDTGLAVEPSGDAIDDTSPASIPLPEK
jgi:hypothetical protein